MNLKNSIALVTGGGSGLGCRADFEMNVLPGLEANCVPCHVSGGFADFIAFVVWVCIFTVAATPGWALYINVITFALAFAGAILSKIWGNHVAAAPAETKTSGPIINASSGPSVPKSFPTSTAAYAAPGVAKSYPGAQAAAKPQGSNLSYTKKWGDWEEMWDEENQAYYFFNSGTGDSAWERPVGWPNV